MNSGCPMSLRCGGACASLSNAVSPGFLRRFCPSANARFVRLFICGYHEHSGHVFRVDRDCLFDALRSIDIAIVHLHVHACHNDHVYTII
jgi:hypothetical protein